MSEELTKAAAAMKDQPKTTMMAILALGAALFPALQVQFDGNPETVADWTSVAALIPLVLGLLFAKDGDKD